MKTAVTTLPYFSKAGEEFATAIGGEFIPYQSGLFSDIFHRYDRIIAIMAIGIVVRGISGCITDKWKDPAVVVVSPDLRFAIPVLGGHHGGNALAGELAEKKGLIPVITTATEALGKEAAEVIAEREGLRVINTGSTRQSNTAILTGTAGIYRIPGPGIVIGGSGVSFLVADRPYALGIGCRLGTPAGDISTAITSALDEAGIRISEIGIVASSRMKSHETGLVDAIRELSLPLIFLSDDELNAITPPSPSAASRFGLSGVAEPAALAASAKKELIKGKQIYGNITIAIAR